jgi:repressor LexA
MPAVLSDLERNILDYMVRYLRTHTYQPSIREIGEEFGIKSTKTVSEHLSALAEKGYLERDPSRSRGVRILGVDLSPNTVSVPCYGALPDPDAHRVTSGVETYLNLDRRLCGANGAYFVRARGSEYSAAGIESGDLFLVEPVDVTRVRDGDLVVAGLGDGQGLYRVYRTGRSATLHPADGSESLHVDRADDLHVTGRVSVLHRRLDGAGIPHSATAH